MIELRNATLEELKTVLEWAAQEGWNPGLDDAAAFYAADSEGFFVSVDDGAPVAAISVVNHNDTFAFLGLYLVRPERRGEGLGLALWNHALEHAAGRVVGLDGVEAQQENYKASGFTKAGGTTRYSGILRATEHDGIAMARAEDIPRLIGLEAAASGAEKPAYLSAWFAHTESRETLIDGTAQEPRGFCTVRKCKEGSKLGPLIARDEASCRRLLEHAATRFAAPIVIDVPDAAKALASVCQSFGMSPSFKTARMYRGTAPENSGKNDYFAVTSLELG